MYAKIIRKATKCQKQSFMIFIHVVIHAGILLLTGTRLNIEHQSCLTTEYSQEALNNLTRSLKD